MRALVLVPEEGSIGRPWKFCERQRVYWAWMVSWVPVAARHAIIGMMVVCLWSLWW